MNRLLKASKFSKVVKIAGVTAIGTYAGSLYASSGETLGTMASSIVSTFAQVGLLITGGSYIAGLAFAVGAIMKFKAHKDNPTNIPIGTPIGLTFIAAALLFLPSILSLTGNTMFKEGASTAGPGGTEFSTQGGK